jgi:NAD(P)-dependent dehydrogenase (short-subunit alcohol dehydrogenase family)
MGPQNPVGLPTLGLDHNYSIGQIPSLTGKATTVTSGSRGIGYQTSLALVHASEKVYIATQSQGKALESIAEIKKAVGGNAELQFLQLKLHSISGAAAAAQEFIEREHVSTSSSPTPGSIPRTCLTKTASKPSWASTTVSHHVFITTLLPLMLATSTTHNVDTRIAVTSSHSCFDIKSAKEFDSAFFTSTKTPTSHKFMDFNIRYARS